MADDSDIIKAKLKKYKKLDWSRDMNYVIFYDIPFQ